MGKTRTWTGPEFLRLHRQSAGPWGIGKLSHFPGGMVPKEMNSQPSVTSLKELKVKENTAAIPINSIRIIGETPLLQKEKPSEVVLALENKKASSTLHKTLHEIEAGNHSSQFKKEESVLSASNFRAPVYQLSQEDKSYSENLAAGGREAKNPSSTGHDNVILLSDDEGEVPNEQLSHRAKDPSSAKRVELCERLTGSDGEASPCNYNKDPVLTTLINNAAVMGEGDVNLLPDGERNNCSSRLVCVKDEDHGKGETVLGSNLHNLSCHIGSTSAGFDKNVQDFTTTRETGDCNMKNAGSYLQHPLSGGSGKPNNESKDEKMKLNANSKLTDNVRTVTGNPSCTHNHLDRYFRQKGPRIAKVVRRINCNVEPLEFGAVHSGKLWCNSQAIFPKGFRSQVRYISILDPSNMCYYISEILDAGRDGPLFMVSLEQCPSEVFIHVSATRCWDMLRDRVNQEISKQHKLGKMKLPPLQPPGSLDGLEMFGFTSPAIVQAIEAMDRNRICTEYWNSRPLGQLSQHFQSKDNGELRLKSEDANSREAPENHPFSVGLDTILGGLFKKANPEELNSLYRILSDSRPTTDRGLLTRLLNEEIHKRPR